MGSANNWCFYLRCFDVFLFVFHILTRITVSKVKPFVSGVLARTKVLLVKKKDQFPLSVQIDLSFVFFFYFTKQNKKNLRYPRWKAVSILWSCQYIFIVFYFFSLGMLLWTAVNLYSSCKLIVRKLYRFLYFGRKVFFLCNKRFPILANVNMQWTWVLLC